MTGVAAVNEMMACQMANGHKYNMQSLTTCVVGGSPMRAELQKKIEKNLLQGRIPIKQGYGASEQGILAVWSMDSHKSTVRPGSVGRPAAGIKIRVSQEKKNFVCKHLYRKNCYYFIRSLAWKLANVLAPILKEKFV